MSAFMKITYVKWLNSEVYVRESLSQVWCVSLKDYREQPLIH